MALHTDVFEPRAIRFILKGLEKSAAAKEKFETAWNENVKKRVKSWKNHKDNKSTRDGQLEWEAEVVEYVDYLHSKVAVHGNASASSKETPKTLDRNVPLLGPRFAPPAFLHYFRRDVVPDISPEHAYTLALTVVHPVFYPTALVDCPQCASCAIRWDGWNGTGARNVYGVRMNERAIGYQLRCNDCKTNKSSGGYCFATTNSIFWSKWEHWRIPRSIPYFFRRSAVTHELLDLVIELRPSSTSAGLAENLKQLHLLEHRQRMLEYLSYFKSAHRTAYKRNTLQNFSSPTDETRYNDFPITSDLITDLYLDFVAKVRQSESVEYCKTRIAKSISLDNTFKSAGKAAIIEKDGRRQNPMKGGILSAINEEGEGLSWRYCMSASPAETRELLQDIGKRHDSMGIPRPSSIIVDNCCQVRRYIVDGLGPDTAVLLDVYHFIIRYGTVVFGGTKNPHRREVLLDIRNAIIKKPAKGNQPATYWMRPEQERKIVEAYNKWLNHGGVWSAAAPKVHADQLEHVRKGCLARPREDISMDGSRIEGSHKAWNSLQRAQPSGIEMYTGLAHDFFLRRNIRIASARIKNQRSVNFSKFVASTYASHHVQLVNHTAALFNSLYEKEPSASDSKSSLSKCPTLPRVEVSEMIGLVESAHSITFGGFVETKDEDLDANVLFEEIDAQVEEMDQSHLISSLGITDDLISSEIDQISSTSAVRSTDTTPLETSSPTLPITDRQTAKRKECIDTIVDSEESTTGIAADDTRNTKRRRYIGPLSPRALLLDPQTDIIELDETPEPCDAPDNKSDYEPTDNVVASEVPVPLPNLNAPSAAGSDTLHAFFRFQNQENPMRTDTYTSPQAPIQVQAQEPILEMLRRPLALPASLRAKGLTRSQLLFSVGTSIDPRALRIAANDEFYLFMDMRAELQWTSFGMTASKWADATKDYNKRLEDLGKKKNVTVIKKNPRALMDKLSEVEATVNERVSKPDRKKTETFWKKHCHAVPAAIKTEGDDNTDNGLSSSRRKRKEAVCTRCKTIMYVGDKNLNHKKGVCSDGVASKQKPGSSDPLPEWPQPQDIFTLGRYFNPTKFLFAVRDLYERVVDQTAKTQSSDAANDYTQEDQAFSRMLESRTSIVEGHAFFLLYDLEFLGGSYESLVSNIEGRRYLRMDCI